ncbi:DUF4180 domain-containing protein [Parapusillimonas sp. SGNA-6]|uniref:DUF4180 domain-containing protein n=1 Tax=Parapedobacter sp. SGR-10 TaxID=2710879 RepID=UPI0013D35E62|nr:DUF4180 domain-containing protein [Parapedobacter sp. SGR-10]NGF57351.1 DUF4180 domain-containing protein [Parapedobacter sp. SGR-10]NGM89927.1 DUF4180 domain-containing protein [Parapusillimonas sp. SGNA-6]
MTITFIPTSQGNIAEIISDDIIINNVEEALDIMANCVYQNADILLLYEKNITPTFFDLSTKLAGDILQKFSTYRAKLIIVGDFSTYNSKSLHDFIYESNKHKRINFVANREEALGIFESN